MTKLFTNLSKNVLSLVVGPRMDREWTGIRPMRFIAILAMMLCFCVGEIWATSTNASVTISTYATANSWENSTRHTSVDIDSHITATATNSNGSNTGTYYSANPGTWRFYQSEVGKLVLTASSGYKITSFTITFTKDDNGTLKYYGTTLTSGTAISGLYTGTVELVTSASSGSKGKILVSQIDVTYVDGSEESTYNLVTDASKLTAGDVLVFGYSTNKVAGFLYDGFLNASAATISDGVLTTDEALEFTLGGSAGAWTLTNNSKYLRATGSGTMTIDATTTGGTWGIAIGSASTYYATITNVTFSTSKIYYNTSSPRFKNYTSADGYIQLYKKGPSCDELGSISGSVTLTKTVRTMTASWSKTSGDHETGYSVQLYDNNGSGAKGSKIGDAVAISGKADGDRSHTFTGLTPNHQYFVGVTPTYSGDGDYCDKGTEVTGNATTNAGYTVTYAAGAGSGTMTDENSPYDAGVTVTILENDFSNPGYPFDGWSAVDASENEVDVSSGSFTMPSSNVTITATWGAAYVDEFIDKEHGNSKATRSGANKTTPSLDNFTPVNDYCNDLHYKFIGWVLSTSVNENGTLKNDAEVVPGGQGSWNCTGATYYAVWAKEEQGEE